MLVPGANLYDQQDELRYLGGGSYERTGVVSYKQVNIDDPNGACNVLYVTPVGWRGMLNLIYNKKMTPSDQVSPFDVGQGT